MLAKFGVWSQKITKKAFDFYLVQDPDYYRDLESLAQKEILFYLQDLHLLVRLQFTRTEVMVNYVRVQVFPGLQDETHLILSGRCFDVLAFALYPNKRSRLLSEQVVAYQGDLFLLEALLKLFKERHFLENVPVPSFVKSLVLASTERMFSWQKYALLVFKNTLVDYVAEELQLIPSYKHFKCLQDMQLDLNESVDRLEAKLDVRINATKMEPGHA